MSGTGSPGAHLAALSALSGMGPARLRALLSVAAPGELWEMLLDGRTRPIVAAIRDPGRDRLFGRDVFDGWVSEARATRSTPVAMEARITNLGLRVQSCGAVPAPDGVPAPEGLPGTDGLTGVDGLPGTRGVPAPEGVPGTDARAGIEGLPEVLAGDPDPPGALFTSGVGIDAHCARVAVVGTRRASEYGLRVARALGRDLAAAGVGVVSGLALGIDAAAHAGALEQPHGSSGLVAVIGAGHDRPCPVRNRGLARAVGASGTIISEVPPGIPSAPWRYPVRNRLIAALADVVVVVESASTGGSMSTVAEALARDRVVMAVPGSLGRRTAQGCHDLLRDGAQICTGAADVVSMLELLGFTTEQPCRTEECSGASGTARSAPDRPGGTGVDRDAEGVLELLTEGPCTFDTLSARTGMAFDRLCSLLAGLETDSLVRTEAGWVHRTT